MQDFIDEKAKHQDSTLALPLHTDSNLVIFDIILYQYTDSCSDFKFGTNFTKSKCIDHLILKSPRFVTFNSHLGKLDLLSSVKASNRLCSFWIC